MQDKIKINNINDFEKIDFLKNIVKDINCLYIPSLTDPQIENKINFTTLKNIILNHLNKNIVININIYNAYLKIKINKFEWYQIYINYNIDRTILNGFLKDSLNRGKNKIKFIDNLKKYSKNMGGLKNV